MCISVVCTWFYDGFSELTKPCFDLVTCSLEQSIGDLVDRGSNTEVRVSFCYFWLMSEFPLYMLC